MLPENDPVKMHVCFFLLLRYKCKSDILCSMEKFVSRKKAKTKYKRICFKIDFQAPSFFQNLVKIDAFFKQKKFQILENPIKIALFLKQKILQISRSILWKTHFFKEKNFFSIFDRFYQIKKQYILVFLSKKIYSCLRYKKWFRRNKSYFHELCKKRKIVVPEARKRYYKNYFLLIKEECILVEQKYKMWNNLLPVQSTIYFHKRYNGFWVEKLGSNFDFK